MPDLSDSEYQSPEGWTGDFSQASRTARVTIGQWPVERYVSFTQWPVLIGAAVIAGMLYVGMSQTSIILSEIALLLLVGWMATSRQAHRTEALAVGIIAGLGVGLIISITRLLMERQFLLLVNIVSETMLTAMMGGVVAILTLHIRQLLFKPK